MQPLTCPACGHEFETPHPGPDGPACPRCGECVVSLVGRWPPAVAVETYLAAALGGAVLGLLAASILLLGRW